jgi:hypothetical protein
MNWILDLLTPLITTSNYSATSNFHISQFTIATAKHFPACYIFNSRSLALATNSGNFSRLFPQLNGIAISSQPSDPCYTASGGSHRKHRFQQFVYFCLSIRLQREYADPAVS